MDRHNPAVERLRIARRPAARAGHRWVIQVVMGALFIAVAGSLIFLPSPEHGEMDLWSMVGLFLCLITLILAVLLMYVLVAAIRLPPVLADYLVSASVAAMVAVLLRSLSLGSASSRSLATLYLDL